MTYVTTFPGTVTATGFTGDGSQLTGLPSSGFDPDVDKIAIGNGAGTTSQGANAVAVGHDAGLTSQGAKSIAIGHEAGHSSQNNTSVAVGNLAGKTAQGLNSVAIGNVAGMTAQGYQSVAVGMFAGRTSQTYNAVAVGANAGHTSQGNSSVAIGQAAGYQSQGHYSIGIGNQSAQTSQGNFALSIGYASGFNSQGEGAIAIGSYAGFQTSHTGSIILNSHGGQPLVSAGTNRFHVKRVRNSGALSYNSSNGEIYGNSSDDRVKHNETYITNALRTIMKLKPQTYDKSMSLESNAHIECHESGFMAQDIWYDVPEMRHIVVLAQTANPTPEKPPAPSDDPRDDPDYSAWGSELSTLNYTQVIPFLTKAVQEVTVEVPRVKTTVSNTWGRNITGLVVSANTNKHKTKTIPMVNLSSISMDKSWYGIVSSEKTDSIDYDTLVDIKGDSRVWVTDVNGPLESGDLITTSNVAPGYTQKQTDDIIRNYTIGKITQDCDFSEPGLDRIGKIKKPKQALSKVNYYIYEQKSIIGKEEYSAIGQSCNKMIKNVIAYRKTEDEDQFLSKSKKEYDDLLEAEQRDYTTFDKKEYYRIDRYETKFKNKMHTKTEVREELVDVLDENGQTVWENIIHAQPVYTLVDHGTHKAALVSCKVI